MIPKKAKDMMKDYAESKGMPYQHSDLILNEYWREVKKMLRELDAPRVRLRGLGNFEIKPWEVYKDMKRHQRLVTSIPINRRGPHMENLERIEEMVEMLNREKAAKDQAKEARKIERNGTQGEDTEDMEE